MERSGAAVQAPPVERGDQRGGDLGHVAGAAHLADEAAAGPEHAPDAVDDRVRVQHPVQGGVGEDRVELALEGELLAVTELGVQAACAGAFDLLGAAVETEDPAAPRGDPFAQRAVAAAEIQYALARPRVEQGEQRLAQVGDEARVALVSLGIPALRGAALAAAPRAGPPGTHRAATAATGPKKPSPLGEGGEAQPSG
jgi:hypothetical protein